MPPAQGWFPAQSPTASAGWGTHFFHILPYLEQGALYSSALTSGANPAGENPGAGKSYYSSSFGVDTPNFIGQKSIPAFVCPSDPSFPAAPYMDVITARQWGTSSYGGNYLAFGIVNSLFQSVSDQGAATLQASFPDGTSNTILYAEKYAVCNLNANEQRANLWDWWQYPVGNTPGNDYRPVFAFDTNAGDNVGPTSIFQERPAAGSCDPSRAATAHPGGMVVALADGSVRTLAASMSGTTWWAAVTPAGGENLGTDW